MLDRLVRRLPMLLPATVIACAGAASDGRASADDARPPANGAAASRAAAQSPVPETFEIVREFPHDPAAFTQGLVYHDGFLYEGTGRRGSSSLRQVDLTTGEVVRSSSLSPALFGEGITILDGKVYQLTWTSGIGLVYDLETLEVERQFRQFTQGWGLTDDGRELIMSDGSPNLYFLDPETLRPTRTVEVRDDRGPVLQINELEYVEGEIYANVWHSWDILRISPRDGRVIGRIDMRGLFDTSQLPDPESVLNGIAYDPDTGRFFVTGKLWPRLFEVRFVRP